MTRVARTARGRKPICKLTDQEIRKIAREWRNDDGPGGEDVERLVQHIRILESEIANYEEELAEVYS